MCERAKPELYDGFGLRTDVGSSLYEEAFAALEKIVEAYRSKGCSYMDMALILYEAARDATLVPLSNAVVSSRLANER